MSRSPELPGNKSMFQTVNDLRKPRVNPDAGWIRVYTGATGDNAPTPPIQVGNYLPRFQNAWKNVNDASGTYAQASYYLSDDGEVRLRGHITGGSAGTVVFTLPEGYRPEKTETFIVPMDEGGYAHIKIEPNGNVTVVRMVP